MSDQEKSKTYDYPLSSVPKEERRSLFETLTVFTGWIISPSAFLVGGIAGTALAFPQAVMAILIGNAILVILGSLMAYIGYKRGLSTYMNARVAFGRLGHTVSSVILGILMTAFVGVIMGLAGATLNKLIPSVSYHIWVFTLTAICWYFAVMGFRGLAWMGKVGVPILWLLAILGIAKLSSQIGGLSNLLTIVPKKPAPLGVGISAALGTWIAGATLMADTGRYIKESSHVVYATVSAFIFGSALFEIIAAAFALGVGSGDVPTVMTKLGMLLPAVLIFSLAILTSADVNLYSFGLACTSLFEAIGYKGNLSKAFFTTVGAIIALATAWTKTYQNFQWFLNLIGLTVGPFAGVIVSQFFLMGKINYSAEQLDKATVPGCRWTSFIAWIVGSIVALTYKAGVPAAQGLVVAMVLDYVLEKAVGGFLNGKPSDTIN